MQIVMQRKFPFCARRERSSARPGPWSRFAGARWRGSCAGMQAAGPGRRKAAAGCRMLLERFAWRDAGSEQGASLAASALNPRCPRNGSPRRTSEPAEERCYRGGERGKPREEELLSNNHLLPLSAIQGRNKIVLSFPLESSTGTEKKAGL